MKKIVYHLCFLVACCSYWTAYSQEELNEFVVEVDSTHNPITNYAEFGATDSDGVLIINTKIADLIFSIQSVDTSRLRGVMYDTIGNRYILRIKPNDRKYRKYNIILNADNFKQGLIERVVINAKESKSYTVNPKKDDKKRLARITVYDKDSNLLEGAKVKIKATGNVDGSTRTDGTHAVRFEKEGETAVVIILHPSYSDTKEMLVQAGIHDYTVYLHNYKASIEERLARIIVYDKDNKGLLGAEVKNITTGEVGYTNSDGIQRIFFNQKGETTNDVIVSHPSYSDTIELTVQAGDTNIVILSNYNPKKNAEQLGGNTNKQKRYNHDNTLAFFESAILPGLGQWCKGYEGHGLANMLGEAALVGGAVYYYITAQEISRQGLIDAGSIDSYNRTVTIYNVFLGSAIALYTFNLLQATIMDPKDVRDAKKNAHKKDNQQATVTPALLPVGNTLTPGIGLTLNF